MPDRAGWVRPDLTGDLARGRVQRVLLWPDPVLLTRCDPAGYLTGPELRQLAADLLVTMYEAGGRGLAAPQIGVLRRVFVMDAGWKDGRPAPLIAADPEITDPSDARGSASETCLSIPGRPVDMDRPEAVTLNHYDLDGIFRSLRLTGPAARIAQHEADHLDGRLILKDPA